MSSRRLAASLCDLGILDGDNAYYQITEIPQLLVFGVDVQEVTELPTCLAAILFYCMVPREKSRKLYCFAVYWGVELGSPSFISWFSSK